MKICMITSAPFPPREGMGNYVLNLSTELASRGHEVQIITRGGFRRTYCEDLDGIRIRKATYLPFYPIHIDIHCAFVKAILNDLDNRFDVIHYHSPLVGFLRTKTPSIVTVHTPMAFDVPMVEIVDARSLGAKILLRLASTRIEGGLFSNVSTIATVSKQVSKELMELSVAGSKITFIGNGVNEDVFRLGIENRAATTVLFVGRLSYRKGLVDLIDASKSVIEAIPEVRFDIVGDGPLRHRLEEHARILGVEKNLRFLGKISPGELISAYQKCGIFVLPSHYEGMATVLLEAMSTGAPVVSTNIGGSDDLIKDGINGLLTPPKDVNSMSKAIIALISDRNRAEKLGKQARETIMSSHTWKKIADKYETIYRKVAN